MTDKEREERILKNRITDQKAKEIIDSVIEDLSEDADWSRGPGMMIRLSCLDDLKEFRDCWLYFKMQP